MNDSDSDSRMERYLKDLLLDQCLTTILNVSELSKFETGEITKERDYHEHLKKLSGIFEILRLVERPVISLNEIITIFLGLLHPIYQISEKFCVRIYYDDVEFKTENFEETDYKLVETIKLLEKTIKIEIYSLNECDFSIEDRNLLRIIGNSFKGLLENIIKGKIIEDARKSYLKDLEEDISIKTEKLQKEVFSLRTAYQDLKETQQKLVESERMASLGKLASGIAHEINNPIMGIINYAHILKEDLKKYENINIQTKPYSFLDSIIAEGENVSKIIQNLLGLAKSEQENFKSADISEIIDSAITLLMANLNLYQIKLNRDLDTTLPKIRIQPQNIRRVILNLVQNAIDALNEKFGTSGSSAQKLISVSTSRSIEDNVEYIKIRIHDNGQGILPQYLTQIFEPFFSTKYATIEHRVGLGLSISYQIIQEHGGKIAIESNWKEFTSVEIFLPLKNE